MQHCESGRNQPSAGPARWRVTLALALLVGLSGCSDGSGGGSGNGSGVAPPPSPPPPTTPPPSPPPPTPLPDPVSQAEAFRLLNQATFGATEAEAERVRALGIEQWIDEQLAQPPSLQLPHMLALPPPAHPGLSFQLQPDRVDIWFRNSLHGQDQLRQRVAFALSQIMVVSQLGVLVQAPWSLADYYDMLARNAFGNFRELIEDVTQHPAMGVYLSMRGNRRPDLARNIRPDENYARELLQLFTIGLVQLELDGTVRRDAFGQPLPTFDQAVVEGFAHVFTGWNFAGLASFEQPAPTIQNQTRPMQLYPAYHDTGEKRLLDGMTLPAGQTGQQDLAAALDTIFAHANVGPFISRQLIQRLVTSNPSPAYVRRVAEVFNDNGAGVRGDLAAVVRAILLDPEARSTSPTETSGKLKEPLLRVTQLWRAYEATSASGRYPLGFSYILFAQGPLQAPSVFNFFSPDYAPPGEIATRGLVAPELQIATEFQKTFMTNVFAAYTFVQNSANPNLEPDQVAIDINEELAIAQDSNALIDRVAAKLLAGQVSPTLRSEISGLLGVIPASQDVARVAETVYFIVTSPEYAYQR